jgi:hypothetical protein
VAGALLLFLMKISRSKNKDVKTIELREGFVEELLPGINEVHENTRIKDWVKYLRIAIAVIRMAEYDYLSKKSNKEDWDSAKAFLFGKNNLFTCVCDLMKINKNMALIKIISYKRADMMGDPIFSSILSEYTERDGLNLSPTSEDINKVISEYVQRKELL